MTATTDVTIWCDGVELDGGTCTGEWHSGHTAKEVRQALGSPGPGRWLVGLPGGRDLCPRHADQRDSTRTWGDGR